MSRKTEQRYITEQADFPTNLRELMKEHNVTQKVLAEVIEMRPQTVSLYIGGQSVPDINTLYKIAEYFNVSADWLIGRPNSIRTMKEDIRNACSCLGLSEDAVVLFRQVTSLDCYRGRRETLNVLLKNSNFYHLLDIIFDTAKAISPEDEVNLPENDRFSGYSTKEVYESLAVNWSAVVVTSTVDMLEERKKENGKH